VFHNSDGAANVNETLVLNLRDFAVPEVSRHWPSLSINIPFRSLAQALDDAYKNIADTTNAVGADPHLHKRKASVSSEDSAPAS
ncbi:hypothetical protein IL306_004400, partial [Fusarium sp. DS 682]